MPDHAILDVKADLFSLNKNGDYTAKKRDFTVVIKKLMLVYYITI